MTATGSPRPRKEDRPRELRTLHLRTVGSGYLGFLKFVALFSYISAIKLTGSDFKTGHVTKRMTEHVTKRDRDHVTSSVASKVEPDDGSWIPTTYRDFRDIFSMKKAETLPPNRPTDHAIDLKLPYGQFTTCQKL
jgi:hypothetical protein